MYKIVHARYTRYGFRTATAAVLWALTQHGYYGVDQWDWEEY